MNYKDFTDEELIAKLRAGDAEIADYIMEKYKPLVRKKTNAMYLIGGETEDLIQEAKEREKLRSRRRAVNFKMVCFIEISSP